MRAPGVRDVQHPLHDDQREDPDRDVDQEDPAPAGDPQQRVGTGEEASDDGAEHARGAEDGEEEALVPGALPRRDDVTDDGQRQGEQTARTEALHGPEGRQAVHRRGERAQHRPDDEHGDGDEEQRLATVDVRQLPVQRR